MIGTTDYAVVTCDSCGEDILLPRGGCGRCTCAGEGSRVEVPSRERKGAVRRHVPEVCAPGTLHGHTAASDGAKGQGRRPGACGDATDRGRVVQAGIGGRTAGGDRARLFLGEEVARVLVAGALAGDPRMIGLVFKVMDGGAYDEGGDAGEKTEILRPQAVR